MSTEARPKAQDAVIKDPYAYHTEDVIEPPTRFGAILRRIGPGMILAASIVGSGELIATTTLGAEVGYLALWIIVISCFLKPAIQSEMGRFTIATGKTGLASFDLIPGPRLGVTASRRLGSGRGIRRGSADEAARLFHPLSALARRSIT